jgi:hypothetical protein
VFPWLEGEGDGAAHLLEGFEDMFAHAPYEAIR